MHGIIEQIISDISVGLAFDAHYVIDTLIRNHSDEYLAFAAEHPARAKRTEYVHSELAKLIATFQGTLIERMESRSISYNIRGNATDCTLWKRI